MKILYTLVIGAVLLTSCSKDAIDENVIADQKANYTMTEHVADSNGYLATTKYVMCGMTDLVAGQHIDAGMFYVKADQDYVYLHYKTTGNWRISETHLYVGACEDMPVGANGNPKKNQFDFAGDHTFGTDMVIYTLDRASIETDFCVIAHAALVQVNHAGEVIGEETAWSDGIGFEGGNWAMYTPFTLAGCTDGRSPETR